MKVIIIILFVLLTFNSAVDWIFSREMLKGVDNLLEISKLHQIILQRQNNDIIDLYNYQTKLEKMHYQVAELAIFTQLKCNIEHAELKQ